MLSEGDAAPDFSLKGSDGKTHGLGEFRGRILVLYFYPRDDTPGCTIEARNFNARLRELEGEGAAVVGVSTDSIDSHGKFISKYGLDFLLLSDPEKKTVKDYDSYGNRGIFGLGTIRNTFVIDGKGRIVGIFRKVKPDAHAEEIIRFLKGRKE